MKEPTAVIELSTKNNTNEEHVLHSLCCCKSTYISSPFLQSSQWPCKAGGHCYPIVQKSMSRNREGTKAHSIVQDINDLSESLSAVNDLQVLFASLPCEFLRETQQRKHPFSPRHQDSPLGSAGGRWGVGGRSESRGSAPSVVLIDLAF